MATKYDSKYTPSFFKGIKDSKPVVATYSDFNLTDSTHSNTDSFKYDPDGFPLKSTQQLNVDWSGFENHCFFSSAEVKVNEAFNKIVNGFPFDGTRKEFETFLDSLTGFEKWVFDSFPRWSGALHFSGTQIGEDPSNGYAAGLGNWISVKDKSGNLYPELAKNNQGSVVINPDDEVSLSVEFLLKIPSQTNGTQIVFQKSSSASDGFTLHLTSSSTTGSVDATFSVSSGSVRNSVTANVKKGSFNHVCVVLNKETEKQNLEFFINQELAASSQNYVNFPKLNADTADLLIGSGSSFYCETQLVTPTQTLSGTIDDFKVYHSARSGAAQKLNLMRGVYASSDLKLYYRFNEPSGSLSLNSDTQVDSIVLDSSGNSLHSTVRNFNFDRRFDVSLDSGNLMKHEKPEFKVVLFPAYADVIALNVDLLAKAKDYDRYNPNTIFKLIPPHYLREGAFQDGFQNPDGNGGDPYGGSGIPGQGEKGSVQAILTFLYIWAKFFDEIKLYLDSFGTLKTVSYEEHDMVPDNFLEDLVRSNGFYLPKFFNHATVDQFSEGQYIEGLSDIDTPLKKIQATITRRVLVNMNEIMKSKGTRHSIKTFLRSVGIDPENSIRIREYGGPTTKQLTTSREKRIEPAAMMQLTTGSLIVTPHLSASRIEPGTPMPVGTFYLGSNGRNAGTNYASDGLLTSGSWNVEAVFKVPPQRLSLITDEHGNQSLIRMVTTGSVSSVSPGLVANVVAFQQSDFPKKKAKVTAYLRPGTATDAPVLSMTVDILGKGIFDGNKWNVSLGCHRNDQIDSRVSSSYYLRVGRIESDELSEFYVTSSFFQETTSSAQHVFRNVSPLYNASGSQIQVGTTVIPDGVSISFLNDRLTSDDEARTSEYVGWAGNLRFWSKGMSVDEWKEHVRNPKSVGVADPLINYNFTKNVSGSFEKLRLDTLQKQAGKNADNLGKLEFVDFSLNFMDKNTVGSGFASGSQVLFGETFDYSYISPMFDEVSTDEKVRIRSFEDPALVRESPWAVAAPSYLGYGIIATEEPQDDVRLSLEFSMVDSLDKDMISMFSTLDFMGDAIGSPEMMFSPDYPDLDRLRDVYFNRLSGKPDFRKFLEFYRWFDISISSFVEQLIPSKTAYKGTNYVIESHLLERHKKTYMHSENYLGQKQVIQDSLLVQQIVGKLNKY